MLAVPLGALFRTGQDWTVYVVGGGRAHRRVVELGHRNSRVAETTAGLALGERVIMHPGERISDGVRVAPPVTAAVIAAFAACPTAALAPGSCRC